MKKIEELEARLRRDITNRKKVVQIVEMLAQRAVQEPDEETVSENEWLEILAKDLLALILESKTVEPSLIKALTNKLEQDTVNIIVLIVKLLGDSRARELLDLLLNKELDDREALKEKLKQDTRQKITDYNISNSTRAMSRSWKAVVRTRANVGYRH